MHQYREGLDAQGKPLPNWKIVGRGKFARLIYTPPAPTIAESRHLIYRHFRRNKSLYQRQIEAAHSVCLLGPMRRKVVCRKLMSVIIWWKHRFDGVQGYFSYPTPS